MSRLVALGRLDDVLELFGAVGPSERATGGVVTFQKAAEQVLEILLGALHAVRQSLLARMLKKHSIRFT